MTNVYIELRINLNKSKLNREKKQTLKKDMRLTGPI
jgi:hypothetical protein